MSKTYEALLRAEKEQAAERVQKANSKGAMISQAAIAPRIKKPKRKTKRGKDPLRQDIRQERYVGRLPMCHLIPDPDSILAEQVRKLQSLLAASRLVDSVHSILLTSCMTGEGKTFTSLNLSTAIARRIDDSAILIDADLRMKDLTNRLGVQKALGLSDVLEQRANIQDTLIQTEIENLKILPAGLSSTHPGELVTSTRMNTLIQELRASYENSYIIIDSTPIAATSEVSALSRMTDRVIVVIKADMIRRDVVKRELKTIAYEKILGIVLNCAEFETSDYYGSYYNNYYCKIED